MDIHCLCEDRVLLGESPVWSAQEKCVYWIDILGPSLLRTDLINGETMSWGLPSRPGMIALRGVAGLIIALEDGLYGFNPPTRQLSRLCHFEEDRPENRANDGKCDIAGRLWLGTMNNTDSTQETGGFYRFDPGLVATQVGGAYRIPNGLAWSPDDTVMYHTDSRAGMVYAYDYDAGTGERSGEREFFKFDREKTGSVDGAAIDIEGGYWTVLYGGGKLIRLLPDGTLDREIPLPVSQPTMPAFGGADMKTLFITTAAQNLSEGELKAEPLAGGLLALNVDVPGHPVHCFGC
ncbi:MAG: SMP-30/gluconolactonase/LRE family protein [Proteobacteria bacterium]|nr:SMP-30/gluconolactonase/LRE family protein [Pseudomonadota bacterium]